MFRYPASPQAEHSGLQHNPFLKRAALFGGALLLLLVAFQLLPSTPPDPAQLYSDTSGTVVTKPGVTEQSPRTSGGFRPGYFVAIALLAGGGAFAWYLRKRTGVAFQTRIPLRTVGAMQMAPGQQLRLVACGEEVLLLGITSSQITLLKTFPSSTFANSENSISSAEESNRSGADFRPPNATPGSSFATLLQQFSAASTPTRPASR